MMLSPWTGRRVDVDPFGPNPALEALKVEQPGVYVPALRGGPAPTMFAAGDLPSFTASGVAPAELNRVPWNQRHELAALAEAGEVFTRIEDVLGKDADYAYENDVYHDFMRRLRHWATTSGTGRAPLTKEESDANYEALFGSEATA